MTRRGWTGKEIAVLRRDYGLRPPDAIAADLGRSYWSVVRQAHRMGVGLLRVIQADAFRALHGAGLTNAEIAQELGVSRRSVKRWRKRLDLPVRSQVEAPRLVNNRKARALEYPRWVEYISSRRRLRYLAMHAGCTTWSQALVCFALGKWGAMPLGEIQARLEPVLSRKSVRRAVAQLTACGVLKDAVEGFAIVRKRMTRDAG